MAYGQAIKISVGDNGTFVSIPRAKADRALAPMVFSFGQYGNNVEINIQNPTPMEARVFSPPQRKGTRALITDSKKGKAIAGPVKRKATESPRCESDQRVSVFSRLGQKERQHLKVARKEELPPRANDWEASSSGAKLGRRARRNRNKKLYAGKAQLKVEEASLLTKNTFYPLTIKEEGKSEGGKAPLHKGKQSMKEAKTEVRQPRKLMRPPVNRGQLAPMHPSQQQKQRQVRPIRFDKNWERREKLKSMVVPHPGQEGRTIIGKRSIKRVDKAQLLHRQNKGRALLREKAILQAPTTKVVEAQPPKGAATLLEKKEGKKKVTLSTAITDEDFDEWMNASDDGLSMSKGPSSAYVCMVDTRSTPGVGRLRREPTTEPDIEVHTDEEDDGEKGSKESEERIKALEAQLVDALKAIAALTRDRE